MKSETLETQTGRKKKDHRHKSGMSGKAKCLLSQDSGHQVATEKKKDAQTGKTRDTRRNREKTGAGPFRPGRFAPVVFAPVVFAPVAFAPGEYLGDFGLSAIYTRNRRYSSRFVFASRH